MKPKRFEKIVKWETDKGVENPKVWLIMFTCCLILAEFTILNGLGKPMNQSQFYAFWLMGGWWFLIGMSVYSIYVCLKQRKVYWRIKND